MGSVFDYYGYRFYSPSLERWLNRDPLGEPGSETLHLVSQPLNLRRLRFAVNNLEMQNSLAVAIQNGSINVGGYLHDFHRRFAGNSISALTFLNLLRNGEKTYAPNWPVELPETPNLYEFLRNAPFQAIDPYGEGRWSDFWTWVRTVFSKIGEASDIANTGLEATECAHGIYEAVPDIRRGNRFKNGFDPFDPNSPIDPGQPAG